MNLKNMHSMMTYLYHMVLICENNNETDDGSMGTK